MNHRSLRSNKTILSAACIYLFSLVSVLSGQTGSPSQTHRRTIAPDTHPRLWVRDTDLARLRSWAVPSNPVYNDGLALLAAGAVADMNAGNIPSGDPGIADWVEFPSEMYAELFAFMSLIHPDQATRDNYAQRARTLLMHVMNIAVSGVSSGEPFRDVEFTTGNRSRWWGEGFGLTVDWLYPYLTQTDKQTIRTVFLRWIDENLNASTTDYNHPEPIGMMRDTLLLADQRAVRWSCNNYYLAHMRNIGLMSMALDSADDAGGQLRANLDNATGAWLYVIDHLLRNEGRGGFSPEGLEYGPEAFGYYAQFLLALHTAGEDNPALRGPQVSIASNSFLPDMVEAYIHSLSPATALLPSRPGIGPVYQPAWYGDGQNYFMPDFIGVFGPLAVYDYDMGNRSRLERIRWIEQQTPPGGKNSFLSRVSQAEIFRDAILLFLMYDPTAAPPGDPRPTLPTHLSSSGLGRILARSDWTEDASMFTYSLGWITIDHQHGDGNQIEFYRKGEWLTKDRTGWDGTNLLCSVGRSDYHNTMTLENDKGNLDPGHFLNLCHDNGSQWMYVPNGDGKILAHSFDDAYAYASGDATELYNSADAGTMDITHASRSVLWLKPDHIIVYDRAESKTDGRFKRFWLNFSAAGAVNGNLTSTTTAKGQQLFVTTLLPSNAVLSTAPAEEFPGDVANDEPMQYRLRVEAPNGPKSTRFLHVLQGADAGRQPDHTSEVISTNGTALSGAVVANACVLFPVNLGDGFISAAYSVPLTVTKHYISGVVAGAKYDISETTNGSSRSVTVVPGSRFTADSGGVLSFATGTTEIGPVTDHDAAFRLRASYPNPILSSMQPAPEVLSIPFELSQQSSVTLDLYDQRGRKLLTAIQREYSGGQHIAPIPVSSLPTGMYFYQFRVGRRSAGGYFTVYR